MTKKSASRLARDAAKAESEKYLKDNNCWDDMNSISSQCAQLLGSHANISALAGNPIIIAALKDPSLFAKNVHVLAQDLKAMHNELVALKAMHAGKSGSAKTPDDNLEAISIYEKYMLFIERHQNVVMPTVNHLTEQIQEAIDLVAANAKEQDVGIPPEQDPNVITDVEVIREVSNN